MSAGACDRCLARTWLIESLSGRLEVERRRLLELLELDDEVLLAAVGGACDPAVRRRLARFAPARARDGAQAAGLKLICRCDPRYPARLRDLAAPPAVLHVAGDLERFLELCGGDPVAVVGTRNPSEYGREMAGSLGRGLAAAGLTVVSGMARGVDAAAHEGALAVDGPTVAVMAAAAHRPYPASARCLHRAVVTAAAAVSELGPEATVWRWTFRARNRIVAALAAMTVVVEAGMRSGSLVTAELASGLSRPVGAVPGRVTTERAAGANGLLAEGAVVVRGAQDVLDHLFGAGVRPAAGDDRPRPRGRQRALIEALAEGERLSRALSRAGIGAEEGLAALAELELMGWVVRRPGGRYAVVP